MTVLSPSSLVCEFFVDGLPAPQGSKNAWPHPVTNKPIMYDANAKTLKPWRKHVTEVARQNWFGTRIEGAVVLVLDFTFVRGKTVKREHMTTTPDLSKLTRAVEDSITDAGIWRDDCLVVAAHTSKEYGPRAGVLVKIHELEGNN